MPSDHDPPDAGALTIPLESRVLGEFISSLLGQSRSIERSFFDRRFEIDLNWLLNLDHIIAQRLASQNQARLVAFSAKFYFANGKTITIEDHEAFRAFQDLSNELCTGLDFRWNYLIKFPLAKLPEKQEIRFQAFTDSNIEKQKPRDYKETKTFVSAGDRDGSLSLTINFTDVTWGEDLYSQMVSYIVAKTEPLFKPTLWMRKFRVTSLLPLAMLAGMSASFWGLSSASNAYIARAAERLGGLDHLKLETLNDKVDLLVALGLARRQIDLFPFVAFARGALVIGILSGFYFLAVAAKASFITINDYSSHYLKTYGKNYDFIKYGVIAALLVGIAGGVFANKIYDVTKDWF
ncbi:hypothetical protein [Bradyrhizobium ganzhouense]|uniref:hypothetical protein n=1 Tax=Bradyrhizobium ganzhouense TaxID=1179767 RepID=UPI003CFB4062